MPQHGIKERRAKIPDPENVPYLAYAKATAWSGDNLRCSADELLGHLAQAKKALRDLGAAAFGSLSRYCRN